jgi:hypothetical protein
MDSARCVFGVFSSVAAVMSMTAARKALGESPSQHFVVLAVLDTAIFPFRACLASTDSDPDLCRIAAVLPEKYQRCCLRRFGFEKQESDQSPQPR